MNFHTCFQYFRIQLVGCGHHGNDVKVTDEDGFLSCSMMINANNRIVKERIWINRVAQRDDMKRLRSEDDEKHKEHIDRLKVAHETLSGLEARQDSCKFVGAVARC